MPIYALIPTVQSQDKIHPSIPIAPTGSRSLDNKLNRSGSMESTKGNPYHGTSRTITTYISPRVYFRIAKEKGKGGEALSSACLSLSLSLTDLAGVDLPFIFVVEAVSTGPCLWR